MKVSLADAIVPGMAEKQPPDVARGDRIKYVRTTLLDIKSQEKFAEVLSAEGGTPITRGAVGNWELGKDVALKNLRLIAELADISLDWLAYEAGERPTKDNRRRAPRNEAEANRVPMVGYVRAGASAAFYATATDPLDWVAPIEDMTKDTVAVQIQGESLGSFFDTWLVYYDEVRSPVTPDLIGKLCVVGLMDDRVVVKKIKKSKTPGLYNLLSNTGQEDIEDVEIIWAARVKQMGPR